jgi:arylsulfatase A-like enzyme
MKTRRDFLKSVPLGIAALSSSFSISSYKNKNNNRPNVILIMTDDQGYGDFGVMGNPIIRTPNIDAMAKQSAQMTNFYVSPVCSPTRACLMTGRYNYRTRVIDTFLGRSMMDPEEVTIAEIIKNTGYATGIFGKWHLGDNYPMRPQDQGFDEVLVHRGGGIAQPSDPPGGEGKYTDPVLFHNGEQVQEKGYCTDVYFNRGMEWMEKIHQNGQNFFMYLSTNAPHDPFHDVPTELYEQYKKMDLNNDQFPQGKGHKLADQTDVDTMARIYAMITNIDDNVGKLFKKLERHNLLDNTIVIFMVDNGPATPRYVAGMRGMKTMVYEGGIRSPLFIHWLSHLKPGLKSDRIAAHIDIMPTILDACNIELPHHLKIDGRSLLPLLTSQPIEWGDRHIVIQAHRGDEPVLYHNFAIRNQRWKLLHASGFGRTTFEGEPNFELYDMENDPLEMHNIAAQRPEIVSQLKKAYKAWFDDVSHTRPDNYTPPRIHIGTVHQNPVVLTRVDWRSEGNWISDKSNGYWMLHAAQAGKYDVRVRFHSNHKAGVASLKIGEQTIKMPFSVDQNEIFFQGIELSKGDLNLQVTLEMPGKIYGPWQVDVIKI